MLYCTTCTAFLSIHDLCQCFIIMSIPRTKWRRKIQSEQTLIYLSSNLFFIHVRCKTGLAPSLISPFATKDGPWNILQATERVPHLRGSRDTIWEFLRPRSCSPNTAIVTSLFHYNHTFDRGIPTGNHITRFDMGMYLALLCSSLTLLTSRLCGDDTGSTK
jgi:hypothetical protein